jgi:hypothetical protein
MGLAADPCGRGSAAARLLGFRVRTPPQSHWCLTLMIVGRCQVEVSATSWSLIQRSPTECGVSECDREASIMRRSWPTMGCRAIGDGVSNLAPYVVPFNVFWQRLCFAKHVTPNYHSQLLRWCCWAFRLCGIQCCILGWAVPNVSEDVVHSSCKIIRNVGNHSPNDNVTSLKTRILIQFQFITQLVRFWHCPGYIAPFCMICFQWSQQICSVSGRIILLVSDSNFQQRKGSDVLTFILPT